MAIGLFSSLIVLAPWLWVQVERFEHFGLSTLSGYNLALGNHADVPARYGSSWGHRTSTLDLQRELRRLAGDDWPAAASDLAMAEVLERPVAALARVPTRLWLLCAPDALPLRHLLHGVYPATPAGVLISAALWLLVAHVWTLSFGIFGALTGRFRRRCATPSLLLILAAATLAAPAVSVAATRLFLPIELLLLPVIGAVLAGRLRASRFWLAIALAVGVGLTSMAALPRVAELYWQPTAQRSAPWLGHWLEPLGVETIYSDRYQVRRISGSDGPGDVTVRIIGARLATQPWQGDDAPDSRRWPGSSQTLQLDVLSQDLAGTALEVVHAPDGVVVRWDLESARHLLTHRRPVKQGPYSLVWLGGGVSPR